MFAVEVARCDGAVGTKVIQSVPEASDLVLLMSHWMFDTLVCERCLRWMSGLDIVIVSRTPPASLENVWHKRRVTHCLDQSPQGSCVSSSAGNRPTGDWRTVEQIWTDKVTVCHSEGRQMAVVILSFDRFGETEQLQARGSIHCMIMQSNWWSKSSFSCLQTLQNSSRSNRSKC